MAAPYSGALKRSLVPQAGAQVWGTGINPIHEEYGSPAVRLAEIPPLRGETIAPKGAVPETLVNPELWGYTLEDSRVTGVDYDARPAWNEQPEQYRGDADEHPAWSASQSVNENFRSMHDGAHRYDQKYADSLPNETVTEGWRNKPKGSPANAKPSDPSQYEMQTSMVQRDRTRVNDHAVARGTDGSRAGIASRIVGQKLKIYSGQLRHYDMFPRQQTPNIPRPFSYRTAGTGIRRWMLRNEMADQYPIERVPPEDPYIGQQETSFTEDYGYTPEDYYG
jgi:hypothetical protein